MYDVGESSTWLDKFPLVLGFNRMFGHCEGPPGPIMFMDVTQRLGGYSAKGIFEASIENFLSHYKREAY